VLLCQILEYSIGTNLNGLMKNKDIRATSREFKESFDNILETLPLNYELRINKNGPSKDQIAALQWMKKNSVSLHGVSLHGFYFDIDVKYLYKMNQIFLGMNFSHLTDLSINIESSTEDEEEIDRNNFYYLFVFGEVSSLERLRIEDKDFRLGINFISCFPTLKNLY